MSARATAVVVTMWHWFWFIIAKVFGWIAAGADVVAEFAEHHANLPPSKPVPPARVPTETPPGV